MHETVGDRYELLERVGSGGNAEVWLATDRHTGREVALKRLHAEVAADPTARARFRGEIAAAGAIRHPNMVGVVDARDDERAGGPWLVMEHVSGGSLAARLRTGDLAPAAAMHIAADIAAALAALHDAGYVHRDVTPGNILLGMDGRARLGDFGLARRIGDAADVAASVDLTAPDDVVGTLRFIPPEVLAGGVATPAADVWSLGAVLFEAVTGMPPFDASSPASLLAAQREAPVPGAGVGEGVDTLMRVMLAAEPASRPGAASIAADLEHAATLAAAGSDPDDRTAVRPLPRLGPAIARPPDDHRPIRPARAAVRRTPAILAAGLASLLLVALAAGWTGGERAIDAEATPAATPRADPTMPPPTAAPAATDTPAAAAPDGDDAGPGGQGGGKGKDDNPGKGKGRGKGR